MRSDLFFLTLVILFVSVGQFASTLYLPSFPAMTQTFHTSNAIIQGTYTVFLISFGAFQFFCGPFSDVLGRRKMILIGISIFIIGSLFCALAYSLWVLFLGRIIQGAGVGCTGAVGRSTIRDLMKTDSSLVKAMAYVAMATMLTPIIAPIIGGYFQEFINWRANFYFILLFSILTGWLIYLFLPETNPYAGQETLNLSNLLQKYKMVLQNKLFIGAALCGGLVYAGEITYNIMSPFMLQNSLHLSPIAFGWSLVYLVVAMMAGSFASTRLVKYFKNYQQILIGLIIILCGNCLLLSLGLLAIFNLWSVILPMMLTMFGIGIVYPNCSAAAMLPFKREVGAAAALYGSSAMIGIGIYTYWVTKFHMHNQLPLAELLLSLTLLAMVIYYILIYRNISTQTINE